jgi:hypothetical protein
MNSSPRVCPWSPLGILVVASLLSGCEAKPRAPALTDDPVFQNDQFGLRMQAPERWKQIASALIPPGAHEKPMQLVGYRSPQMDAAFEIDAAANADLQAVALQPSHGVLEWKPVGPSEGTTVGNAPAVRFRFRGMQGAVAQTKEVVSVRRDGRVLLFVLIAPANDTLASEAAQRAISSVTWRD